MIDFLLAVLPFVALILAALAVAGLWFWWSSGQDDESSAAGTAGQAPRRGGLQEFSDLLFGQRGQAWFGAAINRARSGVKGIGQALPAIARRRGASATAIDDELVEVMRVYRDLADGGVVIQTAGRRYRHVAEIIDDQIARRVAGNITALQSFLGPASQSGPARTQMTTPAFETSDETPPARSGRAKEAQKGKDKKEEPTAPHGMGEQIEELLQQRLSTNPELTHRSIHIQSAPGGGIEIEVDGQVFQSVGDVTDAEVQSFLQDVIRQWEAIQ